MLENYEDLLADSQDKVAALQAKMLTLGTMSNMLINICSQVIDAMKEVEASTHELDAYCENGGDVE